MIKIIIKKLHKEWISIGYNEAITKEPLFAGYKAVIKNGKLSFAREVHYAS